jgi:hypothetical protein
MEKEWERADITAEHFDGGRVQVSAKNVSEFALATPEATSFVGVTVDGVEIPRGDTISPWGNTFVKKNGKWSALTQAEADARPPSHRKTPASCGPIDHAFMSKFIFVRPTGKALNPAVGAWVDAEFKHAIEAWRKVFRGDAPVKDDTAITAEDIKNSNLVLWGDLSSNAVLRSMATLSVRPGGHSHDPLGLPIQWGSALEFHGVKYDAARHVPVLIFPNPLNPSKYIVLNSGPTFRDEALLNNSDQTPKLPDWAIIDINTPPDAKWPGLVVDAGFFDEEWKP